jgi:site-specific recombinase XerD
MAEKESRKGPAALQRSTVEGWLSTQPSPNTRAAYRSDLDAFGRWCARQGAIPLTADTATLVAFQVAREAAGDSAATIRRRWSALSSFYDFAVDRRLTSSNPAVGVDRPKVLAGDPSPTLQLTPGAVAGYRASAAALDPRLEALVALLVSEGLKVGEALALDIDDVSAKSSATTITIRRRGESKRMVLDHDSAKAVRRCVGTRRAGPVFISEKSSTSERPNRLTRFGADHLIRQLRTDDETERVTANALRRFHISTREAAGVVLDKIRDRAGLADVRGVRRYIRAEVNKDELGTSTRKDNVGQRQSRRANPGRTR